MSIQNAANSTASKDVIAGLKSRIVNALGDTQVRVNVTPHPDDLDYRPEEGVSIRVPVAEPFMQSGAGRAGTLVNRRVYVYIATSSLLDVAGNDEIAGYAHLDKEDAVANALIDAPGVGTQTTRVGIKVRWVPGGAEIGRRISNDPSMLVSVQIYDVEYAAPLSVDRD